MVRPFEPRRAPMSPELYFVATLAIKMAVAACFVITATVAAERAGPAIGALIATLPVSAGPAYVFLALDHDPQFISQAALASLALNGSTAIYAVAYVLLAQRQPFRHRSARCVFGVACFRHCIHGHFHNDLDRGRRSI